MEENLKKVAKSAFFYADVRQIYLYGRVTFGVRASDIFYEDILKTVMELESQYLLHPECRHLETKTKIYRNIILGSYLIIYRITPTRIEVLRAFHGSRSPKIIAKTRSVKVD
jgi:toxin ParE1/3/4